MTRFFILAIFAVYTAFASAQQREGHHIMMQYPEVYNSINIYVNSNINDPKMANIAKNEQYRAFLDLAESQQTIDDEAMTKAILKWSIGNEVDYNKSIIENVNIINPFPYLRCNWYAVKNEYFAAIGQPIPAQSVKSAKVQTYQQTRKAKPSKGDWESNINYGQYPGMTPYRGHHQAIPATSLYGNYGDYTNYNNSAIPQYNVPYSAPLQYNQNANQRGQRAVYKSLEEKDYRDYFSPQYRQIYQNRYNRDVNEPVIVTVTSETVYEVAEPAPARQTQPTPKAISGSRYQRVENQTNQTQTTTETRTVRQSRTQENPDGTVRYYQKRK